ncbi:putative osmotically inducible protein Y [Chitinispirillum alkaliphilum]|nr:putative osmotically inducible protein Y [Chitinispirillum alkaliphilum]
MAGESQELKEKIQRQLAWDSSIESRSIEITVSDHTVTLSGNVPSFKEKKSALSDVLSVPGVSRVINKISVAKPDGEKKESDRQIESNIKTAFAINSALDGSDLNTEVRDGNVLLRGAVDSYWKKERALELVSEIKGVTEIEEYISVVPDRQFLDKQIASELYEALQRNGVETEEIDIEVNAGRVVLRGKIGNWRSYSAAHTIAKYTKGVSDLTNELIIVSK